MSDIQIPNLPPATDLTGAEQLEVVQAGVSRRATIAQIVTDANVPTASSTLPGMDGGASAGVEVTYSRGDHIHPTDTTRLAVSGGTITGDLTVTGSLEAGDLLVDGASQFNDVASFPGGAIITGGVIDDTIIGLSTPSIGNFTNLSASGTVSGAGFDALLALYAPKASPVFTGDPKAPTPLTADNDTSIATTAFVKAQGYAPSSSLGTMSTQNANAVAITGGAINGTTIGATTPSTGSFTNLTASGTVSGAGFTTLLTPYALVNSQVFTGTPSLPTGTIGVTQAAANNTTALATTAYVKSQNYITGNQTLTLSGDVTGSGTTAITATVVQLQGRPLSASLPATGNLMGWNGSTWLPVAAGAAAAGGTTNQIQYNNGGVLGGISQNGSGTVVMTTNSTAVVHQNTLGITGAAATDVAVTLNKPASGKNNFIYGQMAASNRWSMNLGNATAEAAGNVGSWFEIKSYDNAGAVIGTPFQIERASGDTYVNGNGATPCAADAGPFGGAYLTLNKKAGAFNAAIGGSKDGLYRWQVALGEGTAETGSNVGSNFGVYRFSDAGAFIDAPLSISRNTGQTNLFAMTCTTATVTPAAGFASLYLNKPISGSTSAIYGQKAGSNRWSMEFGNSVVEGGSNAGSNFSLSSYSDAGASLGTPLQVHRAGGYVYLNGNGATAFSNTYEVTPFGHSVLRLNKAGSGKTNVISGASNGLARWDVSLGDGTVESTGNNGSDFTIGRYSDAGVGIDAPLTISRLNGITTFTNNIYTTGLNIPGGTGIGPTFIEVGSTTSVLQAFIDFHSSGAGPDFDCRLISQGGGGGDGLGNLSFYGAGGFMAVNGVIDPVQGIACRAGQGGGAGGYNFSQNWVNPGQMDIWVGTVRVGYMQTISDYRTKKDIAPLASTWGQVLALNPVSYTRQEFQPPGVKANAEGEMPPSLFTADDTPRWGFVAHELQEALIDDAATGVKDGEDVESPNPWTVIAALTKALQEAMTRIEALEARA